MWDISVCHHCTPKSASSHAKKHAPIGSHSASPHAKKINLCSSILCFFSSLNQNSNDFYVSSTLQKSSSETERQSGASKLGKGAAGSGNTQETIPSIPPIPSHAIPSTRGAPIPSHAGPSQGAFTVTRLYRHTPRAYTVTRPAPIPSHAPRLYSHTRSAYTVTWCKSIRKYFF